MATDPSVKEQIGQYVQIGDLPLAAALVGDEIIEIVQLKDGVQKSFRVEVSSLKVIGEDGKSAYEVAQLAGFQGTEAEWLATLIGLSALEVVKQAHPEVDTPEKFAEFITGEKGKSAYEVAFENNPQVGTEVEWLASLIGDTGAKGETGPAGPQGEQGTTGEQGVQGEVGPVGPAGPDGPIGPQGETGEKGDVGPEGPLGPQGVQGEQGTEGVAGPVGPIGADGPQGIQGIQGIQGEKGDAGEQGVQGEVGPIGPDGAKGDTGEQGLRGLQGVPGHNTTIAGTIEDPENLPDPTEPTNHQQAWLVDGSLYVVIENVWTNVGDLRGNDGIGLRILGDFPTVEELPLLENTNGDCYIVNEAMYVWSNDKWVKVGQVGPEGKTAYQIAVKNGFQGTEAAWLLSINGKSAFEVAKAQGFVGTVDEWLVSLKGEKGERGEKGDTGDRGLPSYAIKIVGHVANQAALPGGASLGDAYILEDTRHLHVWIDSGWYDAGEYNLSLGTVAERLYKAAVEAGEGTPPTFGEIADEAEVEGFGYFKVYSTPRPVGDAYEVAPVKGEDGKYHQTWVEVTPPVVDPEVAYEQDRQMRLAKVKDIVASTQEQGCPIDFGGEHGVLHVQMRTTSDPTHLLVLRVEADEAIAAGHADQVFVVRTIENLNVEMMAQEVVSVTKVYSKQYKQMMGWSWNFSDSLRAAVYPEPLIAVPDSVGLEPLAYDSMLAP